MRVLMTGNSDIVIYNFRLELVERLISEGYEVYALCPYGERIKDLERLGVIHHNITMNRHGVNPISELGLISAYRKEILEIKPDVILGFTIKPNLYGAIVARKIGIPFIANITGLGTAVEEKGRLQNLLIHLYRYAFSDVKLVYFQNKENIQFFLNNHIKLQRYDLLPGSGVNLNRFSCEPYPKDDIIRFGFVSRIMKEKGIEQYLDAAEEIHKRYGNKVEFHVCGFCEPEYDGRLQEEDKKNVVIYHGMIKDVHGFMSSINCLIHPSFYPEGLSNVLLEASATGRPVITTDRSGCCEVVDDGITGFIIPQRNAVALIEAIEKFIHLGNQTQEEMGLRARNKVEKEFSRQIVVEKYMNEIHALS